MAKGAYLNILKQTQIVSKKTTEMRCIHSVVVNQTFLQR